MGGLLSETDELSVNTGPLIFPDIVKESFAGMLVSLSGDSDSHLCTGGQTSHASVSSLETQQTILNW